MIFRITPLGNAARFDDRAEHPEPIRHSED
jgi:hypothetical protein